MHLMQSNHIGGIHLSINTFNCMYDVEAATHMDTLQA